MENTVTISISEYDELREIKKKSEIEEPYKHTVRTISTLFYTEVIKTDDDTVEKLAQEMKVLNSDRINKQYVLDSVKKMSCREFRKWKKTL